MRVVIIGNSQHFNEILALRFTPRPSKVTVRLNEVIYELEVTTAAGEIETHPTWMIEAVQSDGIIYALVPENDPTWITYTDPSTFLSTLNSLPIPSRPSILVTSHRSIFSSQNPLTVVKRCIEIDPETGENCGEALLSIVYWMTRKRQ